MTKQVPFRCSVAARARGDSQVGTASPASRWLLVEQPGPWGTDAFTESRLDPVIGQEISRRAVTAGMRPVLIRRAGRDTPAIERRWMTADSRIGRESVRIGTFSDVTELLTLPLDGTAGESSSEPVYLVCTHGRHDTCCAIYGRPVAIAFAAERADQTWECSHLGGDRFAANLVALPHGLYYGYVVPADAAEIVRSYEQKRMVSRLLRGRSSFVPAVQAAQHQARIEFGDDHVDDFAPLSVTKLGPHEWDVQLDHHGKRVAVDVWSELTEPARTTCSVIKPVRVRVFKATISRRGS